MAVAAARRRKPAKYFWPVTASTMEVIFTESTGAVVPVAVAMLACRAIVMEFEMTCTAAGLASVVVSTPAMVTAPFTTFFVVPVSSFASVWKVEGERQRLSEAHEHVGMRTRPGLHEDTHFVQQSYEQVRS